MERRIRKALFVLLGSLSFLTACAFDPPSGSPAPPGDPEPPPITCGNLMCSGNATCLTGPARCECKSGFTGDGMQCADVDECAVANGDCPAACANVVGAHECYAPATCAAVAEKTPGFTGDVEVTLFVGGNAAQPWTAYCHPVNGTYHEFLTLADPEQNYSQYTAGGKAAGNNVRTKFSKIRIDPMTLRVSIGDKSFATSSQTSLVHPDDSGDTTVISMPYAVAMNCRYNTTPLPGPQPADGIARIDLTGTRFRVTGVMQDDGGNSSGSTDGNDQVLTLTGRGACGWFGPAGLPSNPFNDRVNDTNGKILRLRYSL